MKKIRVAINGAGRIGRAFYKVASKRKEIEIVAINDLADIKNIAYLLKYDTAYGKSGLDIKVGNGELEIDGKKVVYISEKDPQKLPWGNLKIDIVVESTGLFTSYEKSKAHIQAGAKRVVISAPAKDVAGSQQAATVLLGINEDKIKTCEITSNASCTTNAASPLLAILDEAIGIEKAILNTVHGYTASQGIVDGPNKKDFKEGRAAAQNIVPTSTGAAIAVSKALTQFEGKFDGISMRVPIVAGSIVDVTFIAKKNTSVEEINNLLKKAAGDKRLQKVFSVTEDQIVSSDIVGSPYASIADLGLTKVIDGNLVKVCAWYDNEMGYTYSLVEHVIEAGKLI
ncbi:type I glyceraldehyde-3-phosphate dehydrogenase [Candidatus Nomurabacteria bacterium]|nr:type I glyceraldehyde-3-phosphate dehydrogenase [Candidatus Nomurabacteria bacterium]